MVDNSGSGPRRVCRYVLYRLLRSDKAISTTQNLADALGNVSVETAYRWTNGLATPSADQVVQICEVLGTVEPLQAMAHQIGCRVVEVEGNPRDIDCRTITTDALRLSSHVAGIHSATMEAVQDGRLSVGELQQLVNSWKDLDAAVQVALKDINGRLSEACHG